jgi:hypothetical protein
MDLGRQGGWQSEGRAGRKLLSVELLESHGGGGGGVLFLRTLLLPHTLPSRRHGGWEVWFAQSQSHRPWSGVFHQPSMAFSASASSLMNLPLGTQSPDPQRQL